MDAISRVWDWFWSPPSPHAGDGSATAQEVEAERGLLMRRRLVWCFSIMSGLGGLALLGDIIFYEPAPVALSGLTGFGRRFVGALLSELSANAVVLASLLWSIHFLIRAKPGPRGVLDLATWVLVGVQAFTLIHMALGGVAGRSTNLIEDVYGQSLGALLVMHSMLSLFLPWSPREAVRPLVPLLVMHVTAVLILGRDLAGITQAGAIALGLLAGLPGVLLCAWRYREASELIRLRVLGGKYGSLARDLVDARKVHEAIFPQPVREGPVRLAYHYTPAMHLGGDFVYARSVAVPGSVLPVLHAAVVDVTGHGVVSALTVNRLFAEIERTLAERPTITPGELMSRLNDYLHYTLAIHCVYATALCLRVDPNPGSGELRWASAGHPPALLRRATGQVQVLGATACMLGVVHGAEFQPGEAHEAFAPGDLLLSCTDGAVEARDEHGQMLELAGLERLFTRAAGLDPDAENVVRALAAGVGRHQGAGAKDDLLLVAVGRPALVSAPRPPTPQPTSSGSEAMPSVRSRGPESVTSTSAS